MLFWENVRLAFQSIRANKMRALLTMLGIIIGIAAVIAIMTVGNSVTSSVTDTMASMGATNIIVSLQQKTERETTEEGLTYESEYVYHRPTEDDYFTYEMIQNFCDTYPNVVKAISVDENVGSGQIVDGKLYANVNVTGASTGYFVANDMDYLSGRYFTEDETNGSKKVALISDKAVNNLFKGDVDAAVGQIVTVNIGDKFYNFTVVGVYKYEASAYSFSFVSEKDTTTSMYIPLSTAKDITHVEGYSNFTVVASSDTDATTFAETTTSFFDTYYRNNRNFEPTAFNLASIMDSMSSILGTITTAISVIGGIALLVGGIGVMNIMLVSITERTREIGTRKALGAPNSSIRMQFIVEAVVICVIGGIIGMLLGIAAGIFASNLIGAPATPSISSIVISILFSMAIGVFFGYYPANKAAKMNPIDALRYE